jgi:hypothetical protein
MYCPESGIALVNCSIFAGTGKGLGRDFGWGRGPGRALRGTMLIDQLFQHNETGRTEEIPETVSKVADSVLSVGSSGNIVYSADTADKAF